GIFSSAPDDVLAIDGRADEIRAPDNVIRPDIAAVAPHDIGPPHNVSVPAGGIPPGRPKRPRAFVGVDRRTPHNVSAPDKLLRPFQALGSNRGPGRDGCRPPV